MGKPIDTRRLTRLAMLAALALVLFLVETALPRPLPWMRLGLSNSAVLAALLLFGAGPALVVACTKLLVGGLLSGSLGGPAFVIGSIAGITSLVAMALFWRLAPRLFSPVGLSVLGAVVHQCVQLMVAATYLGHAGLYTLLPMFLVSGVLTGTLTGFAAYFALQRLAVSSASIA
jgi:heptaprenyl diphosphate synthase